MANMTTQQFKNAKLADGHHVVSVTDHKTASCHGPAKIILTPVLFAWLLTTSDRQYCKHQYKKAISFCPAAAKP
jgi:hypothetical protein